MGELNEIGNVNRNISVYIRTNTSGKVTAVNSSVFIENTEGWLKIDEGIGDKYAHAQGNYFEKPLIDEKGLHNYVWENETIREATKEEKEAELLAMPKPVPSAEADLLSMAVDHEYRLTLLEIGVQ